MKTLIYNDIATGVINESMIHAVSNGIVVKAKLVNNVLPALEKYLNNYDNIPEDKKVELSLKCSEFYKNNQGILRFIMGELLPLLKSDLSTMDEGIVGYIIRGNDNLRTGLSFEGIDYDDGKVLDYRCALYHEQDVVISNAEIAAFLARRTINGEISNAKLYHKAYNPSTIHRPSTKETRVEFSDEQLSKVYKSQHEYLRDHALHSTACNIQIDIDPRRLGDLGGSNRVNITYSNNTNNTNNKSVQSNNKGLFNMFKRK